MTDANLRRIESMVESLRALYELEERGRATKAMLNQTHLSVGTDRLGEHPLEYQMPDIRLLVNRLLMAIVLECSDILLPKLDSDQ